MMKKSISLFLACVSLLILFASCSREGVGSSSIAIKESLIVGSAYEPEYPNFTSSIDFSDASVTLSEVTSKENSSKNNSKVDKSSSSKKLSSSSKTGSLKVSSDKSSSMVVTETSSVVTSASSKTSSATTQIAGDRLNYSTTKAVWISYIDFASILTGKTENQFKSNFETVCKNCVDFGINTLVCQVRAFGDAAYPSEYFAWASMAAGIGKNPNYDPLKIMTELAHKYNLSIHAWINPFRTYLNTDVSKVPDNSVFKKWYNDSSKKGRYIVNFDGRWYYNPGEPEVRELIKNGIVEIIENYNVDAIHIDDYFYPTKDNMAVDSSFDLQSFKAYGAGKTLENWRRENVSLLIKDVYNTIKSKNSNILFGISPQANNDNNFKYLFADVETWCKNSGYIDYICPQVYFSYKSESLAFKQTIEKWNKLVTAPNVKLMIGIAPYRIGWLDTWACANRNHTDQTVNCGKFGWQTTDPLTSNILERQVTDSLSLSNCKGVFFYSYNYLFDLNSFSGSNYASNAKAQAEQELKLLKQVLK